MTMWNENCADIKTSTRSTRTNVHSSDDPSRRVITRSLFFEVVNDFLLVIM